MTASARTSQICLVAAFLTVISLPLAANLAGFDGADPGAENRRLAAFPRFEGSVAPFTKGLSAWFEDHFGFRSTLVRWFAGSRYFVLRVSPSASVIKGADGWLFYGEDGSVEDYARERPMSVDEVHGWRETLARTNGWLRSRDIAHVFVIAPDKHAIYPEHMPASIRRVSGTSRTDQVLDGLRGTGVAAVDLRPALLAAKTRERIYQKTDTHWNDRGALVAYQDIVAAARLQLPAIPPSWTRDDFETVARDVEALDLAAMMGLKRAMRELDLLLVPRRPRLARVVEPPGAPPTAEEGLLVTEIPGSTLPRAVVFRDSFASRVVPFLSEHFSRTVYLWQNDFDADVVSRERPDIVIQQIVGRHLHTFVPSPELIPHD